MDDLDAIMEKWGREWDELVAQLTEGPSLDEIMAEWLVQGVDDGLNPPANGRPGDRGISPR